MTRRTSDNNVSVKVTRLLYDKLRAIIKQVYFLYRNHKFLVTSNMNALEWTTNSMTIFVWWIRFILWIFQQGLLHAIVLVILLVIICLMAKVDPTKSLSITAFVYLIIINYTATVQISIVQSLDIVIEHIKKKSWCYFLSILQHASKWNWYLSNWLTEKKKKKNLLFSFCVMLNTNNYKY